MIDRVPITVLIRNNSTGEIVEHADYALVADDVDDDEFECGLNLYIWADGNFACDCNRGAFFYEAKGIKDMDVECGDTSYSVKILRDGMVVYDEWEDE